MWWQGFCPKHSTVRETRGQRYYLGGGKDSVQNPEHGTQSETPEVRDTCLCGATPSITERPEQSEISAVSHTAVRDAKLADIPVLVIDTSREIPGFI